MPAGMAICVFPFVSTGAGLLLGLVLALAFGNPWLDHTRKVTRTLLALSIVGLGAGMDLRIVARVGVHGFVYTIAGISTALAAGAILARLFGVARNVGTLISVGTAICGGSAIAAIVPLLRPKEHETSIALGTVFLLNAVALFLFPAIGHAVGLGDAQFGLWSALAIHDTSSVVGAAVSWGGRAVEIATTVKLARALWIVPLTLAIAAWHRRISGEDDRGKPSRPWFIVGFVAAAGFSVPPGPPLPHPGTAHYRRSYPPTVTTPEETLHFHSPGRSITDTTGLPLRDASRFRSGWRYSSKVPSRQRAIGPRIGAAVAEAVGLELADPPWPLAVVRFPKLHHPTSATTSTSSAT